MSNDKKVELTVSSLSGDVTLDVPPHQRLAVLVEHAVHELHLSGGPWVLDKNGVPLDQSLTVEEAGLVDGDVLVLSPEEGGGGSGRE